MPSFLSSFQIGTDIYMFLFFCLFTPVCSQPSNVSSSKTALIFKKKSTYMIKMLCMQIKSVFVLTVEEAYGLKYHKYLPGSIELLQFLTKL